jgi:hypothetical protein
VSGGADGIAFTREYSDVDHSGAVVVRRVHAEEILVKVDLFSSRNKEKIDFEGMRLEGEKE